MSKIESSQSSLLPWTFQLFLRERAGHKEPSGDEPVPDPTGSGTAPTTGTKSRRSIEYRIEEGIVKLNEIAVKTSIDDTGQTSRSPLGSIPDFRYALLLSESRPDRRSERERRRDEVRVQRSDQQYPDETALENFAIRRDSPVVQQALAGKLTSYHTQRVFDRIRNAALSGSNSDRAQAVRVLNDMATTFIAGKSPWPWNWFGQKARATKVIGAYYANLAKDYAGVLATKDRSAFSKQFDQQTSMADRFILYHCSGTGKSLLKNVLSADDQSYHKGSMSSVLNKWETACLKGIQEVSEARRNEIDTGIREAFGKSHPKAGLLERLASLNASYCQCDDVGKLVQANLVMDNLRRDENHGPFVAEYCLKRLQLSLGMESGPVPNVWQGASFESIISVPVLATAILPLVRNTEDEAGLKQLQDAIRNRFGDGGMQHLAAALVLAGTWIGSDGNK